MQSRGLLAILTAGALSLAATPLDTRTTRSEPTTPSRDFVVRAGTLHVGDGSVLENAYVVVRNGRIAEVGVGPAPAADLPVLDASDRVVAPGLIAADTNLSGHGDNDYNVTPDFVALDGFDFLRTYKRALSGGVTTAYLAPGRNRLVSGQGSVVKLAGDDLVQRVVAERACLRVTLGRESTTSPALFEPTIFPTADDPLLPARKQFPTARISQLATLFDLFATASRATGDDLLGPGSAENTWDPTAIKDVVAGRLGLRVAAREAQDVRRAIRFKRELGGSNPLVLENPYQIAPVARYAADNGVGAVFRIPVRVSSRNSGGEDLANDAPRNEPENAGIAARAGMKVAITTIRDGDLADFLMVAGIAVRFGFPADRALSAITLDAATLLGIDDRVGSIARGKDADFLVLSGEPFAVGTMVEKTFVDGRPVFERKTDSALLAVRAGKVITAEGTTHSNGVVLVANGKIKGVGEELAVPYGARVIDVPNGVVVPGFVDAYSALGLSGRGSGVPSGAADQRIADVVDPDDPNLALAAAAGLTTALVSGSDSSGTVAGRVTAIKTAADSRDDLVVRDIAGIRFVHDKIGGDGIKPVADAIARGKKYLESWQKYEKALADYEAGKAEKPPEEEAPADTGDAPAEDPVSGTWELEMTGGPMPRAIPITLEVKLSGTKVTGTASISLPGRELPPADIENGKFEGGELSATISFFGQSAEAKGKIENDTFTGTIVAMGNQELKLEGVRTKKGDGAKTAAKTSDEDSDKPKKPKVDENLEPLKALLEGKVPAVIRTKRAPAIRDVVAWFEKEKIDYVLQDVDDAIDTPELLGESPPPVLLGPTLVRRDGEDIVNAAAVLADRDVALGFATGDVAGARYLPLHAAHAIRYGLDPVAALHAMTIEPARMFKIDDRVGSLKRGKDADFVVFDGNPFEPTSRIVMVVCNGEIVVDKRTEGDGR